MEEIQQLKDKLSKMEMKAHGSSVVLMKSDRKFPKFAGRPVKDSDPDVDEWITDMREHIQSTPSKDDHVAFIMDHLTGSAKSEVRLRPSEDRETGDQILHILEKVFDTKDTVTQLRQRFYQRDQREGETLESYSLILMQLADKINKKIGKEMPMRDNILIERFIDGVKNQYLRQELRKFSIEKGMMPFFEFHHQMLRWIEDNPPVETSVRKTSATVENSELLAMLKRQQDILEKQQEQIDKLTNMTSNRGHIPYQNSRFGYKNRYPRMHGRGRVRSSNAGDIECFNCGGEGHIARSCPSEKSDSNGQSAQEKKTQHPKGNPPRRRVELWRECYKTHL